MRIALLFHLLGVVVWVGGMFFAYMALRPVAADMLQPPQRLRLWVGVFGKFFLWVWLSIAMILSSGLYMLLLLLMEGSRSAPWYTYAMVGLGVVMMLIFAHVFFAPYKKLKNAVDEQTWPQGAAPLGQIRIMIGVNLGLGLATLVVVMVGQALA